MCVIYMDTFNWQVVATFFAAGGAVIVGWRQVGIADGQRAIAASQAATARAAVQVAEAQALTARLAQRGNLFEKRLKVYNTVEDYIRSGLNGAPDALIELNPEVNNALNTARFLFPEHAVRSILDIFAAADECADMRHDDRTEMSGESSKRLRQLRAELRSALADLSKRMGDEMQLYVDPVPSC